MSEMLCLGCGGSWLGCLSRLIVWWIMLGEGYIVLPAFFCDKGCSDGGGTRSTRMKLALFCWFCNECIVRG